MTNHQHTDARGPWMQTYGGGAFYLYDPQPAEVNVEDIAHALSLTCRYSGHTREFYLVAHHACLVAKWMEEDGYDPVECYAALHHDSAEAYTGDITPQLKDILGTFRSLEHDVEVAIDIYFGIKREDELRDYIKRYDLIALATERRDLLSPNFTDEKWGAMSDPRKERIKALKPYEAEGLFLAKNAQIIEEINNERDRS